MLGVMFYTCIRKDTIHANRIFALMVLLELDWFCNCLQPGLGLLGRQGQSEFCLLKKVSKSPAQAAALAARGEAEEKEEWGQRAEKEAPKSQDCCWCCKEDGRDGGDIPGSSQALAEAKKAEAPLCFTTLSHVLARESPFLCLCLKPACLSLLRVPQPYGSFSANIRQGSTPLFSSPTLALDYFLWSRHSLVSNTL